MKEIMKKVSMLRGVVFTTEDILNYLDGAECMMEKGEFYITTEDVVVVKVKGKVIDNKDVTISFEEV